MCRDQYGHAGPRAPVLWTRASRINRDPMLVATGRSSPSADRSLWIVRGPHRRSTSEKSEPRSATDYATGSLSLSLRQDT